MNITIDPFSAPADDLSRIRDIARTQGFCLIKGVFAPAEMEKLLDGMRSYNAATIDKHHDFLSWEPLRWLLFDARMIAISRALLGNDLVYYGMSNVSYEETIGKLTLRPLRQVHPDASGTPESLSHTPASTPHDSYPAYRFALYFQDYRRNSGGLKVVPGSHVGEPTPFWERNLVRPFAEKHNIGGRAWKFRGTTSPMYNVPSQPGDVVVWNLRTFHAAGARMFVDESASAVHPNAELLIEQNAPHLLTPVVGPRNALFMDYGAIDEHTDLYIKHYVFKNISRAQFVQHRSLWPMDDEEAFSQARTNGIEIRYDHLMVPLALNLLSVYERLEGATPTEESASDLQAEAAAHTARLFKIMSRHQEFSPYFRLFTREKFDTTAAIDPTAAVRNAAMEINLSARNARAASGYEAPILIY